MDVIVVDDEDICRTAAASALRKFGFRHDKVHEVESNGEALSLVAMLQAPPGQRASVPIIIILPSRFCAGLRETPLPEELFVVSATATARQVTWGDPTDQSSFSHCLVPMTFEVTMLAYLFELCQRWWVDRNSWMNGSPSPVSPVSPVSPGATFRMQAARSVSPRTPINNPISPRRSAGVGTWHTMDELPMVSFRSSRDMPQSSVTFNELPMVQSQSTRELRQRQRLPRQAQAAPVTTIPSIVKRSLTPLRSETPSRRFDWSEKADKREATPTPRLDKQHLVSAFRDSGRSMDCLDHLLPPRPPFEDIHSLCLVGRGSFGRVYKARWDSSFVALKVVEHYGQGIEVAPFEGALSLSLAHPNLVQTFKHSSRQTNASGGTLRTCEVWIVQEWCSLGTLGEKIKSQEIIQLGGYPEVAEVCCEIASAALYLHDRGIIHGDLTANNVLLVERSVPKGYVAKVSDFGLARVLDSSMSAIQTATIGTVSSMPPEVFQLEGSAITKKVDTYAFGVLMWQLCCSKVPFEGLQPIQVAVVVAQGATLELPFGVPEPIADLYAQCTSRDPAQRLNFNEIVAELLDMAEKEILPPPPTGCRANRSLFEYCED